ncbi:hypothetical protein GGR56DRAFT_675529 [Xylariaceae sp. FL0804]|nr:hypothetical protein GGR56DRAFT_675529 [Xylariaceae sp. FL0804]
MDHKRKEESELPPYSAVAVPQWRRRRLARRTRSLTFVGLACLVFIVYAQWTQLSSPRPNVASTRLSAARLRADLETCAELRSKPKDPIGAGRERNARYVAGHRPTLITNATIWVGEPVTGTSDEDARAGKGYSWVNGDVYLEHGLVKKVGSDLEASLRDSDVVIFDARGRPLTSGIIDMHSHAGVDSLPELRGNDDVNEMSSDITPYVRSIDGIQPNDHQIQVIKSGGVTTSLILPGSGNNIGGEAYVIKHAVGKADGRTETSATDMLADPERNWRYIKMACGENAKRVYGKVGERGPVSRLGESWEFRHAFEQAARLVRAQDDWCDAAGSVGAESMDSYLPQDLEWETLGAVLRGKVHVNTHCYTIPDLEAFVDHTNEFQFPVRAFHHAHQTYLVPEILKRAYGDSPPASALFADNMWYKAEAYVGSEHAGRILYDNGLTPIYVSDNPVLNAQHVVFEAAKAFGYGLPYHAAMASVTTAPAERLGLDQRLGKVKPGYDADVVVWDSDPMSVGATPVQVWIDGTAQFEDPVELAKPFVPLAEKAPLETLAPIEAPEAPVPTSSVIFTGITRDFLTSDLPSDEESQQTNLTMVVSNGKVTCLGACREESTAASQSGTRVVSLANGYVTRPFTVFGSTVGLNAIDAEAATDNGAAGSADVFSRALDGLALDTKKLRYARRYGVTRAVSAPKLTGQMTHQGTSVGFRTGARHALEAGAVFADDAAVHYTLGPAAKRGDGGGSISHAVGELRRKLLAAVDANATALAEVDPVSESVFLARVVNGTMPLAITVHSADVIASVLRIKTEVEAAAAAVSSSPSSIRLVILGGAESFLLADELAAAQVGVVLSPLLAYRETWDQRRALTGAPLTNGTAVDALAVAGVRVAVGIEEDWLVRDLGLLAGIAHRNSGGRIGERDALDMVGRNVHDMLGMKKGKGMGMGMGTKRKAAEEEEEADLADEFLVFEGSPLEVGAKVRAVADGMGQVDLFA